MPVFDVKFWGVRGSIPVPGPNTQRYGGNTSCVVVNAGTEPIILDAGTGIREYGHQIMKGGPRRLHILISHTHWDHIQGFPFFIPIYSPEFHITCYGPRPLDGSLQQAVLDQLQYKYFPVRGMELACKLDFVELDQESVTVDGVRITTKAMNHPIRVLAYRLEKEGKSVVYTGDNEPYYDVMYDPARPDTMVEARAQFVLQCRQEVIDFFRSANLLIADAQYTDEEYRQKRGWGHCSVTHAVDFAVQAGVETMALFHHEPVHSDEHLDGMLDEARRMVKNAGREIKVMMAREGITIQV